MGMWGLWVGFSGLCSLVFICHEAFPESERGEGPRTPGSFPTAASSCTVGPRGWEAGAQRQRGAAWPRGAQPGCCPGRGLH